MGKILSVDIGGHRVKMGLFENKNTLQLAEAIIIEKYPSVANNPSIDKSQVDTNEKIDTVINLINNNYAKFVSDITHLGISSTDIIDTNSGIVLRSTSTTYVGTNWPLIIKKRLNLSPTTKLYIQNDAKCGAWSDYLYLRENKTIGKRVEKGTLVRVTVGSGVGSGIVINGKIIEGSGNVAGEIAYIPYKPKHGYKCEYGRGCVEKHASASGLIKTAQTLMKKSSQTHSTKTDNRITLDDIQWGIVNGDPNAINAVDDASTALGYALTVIINFLGPDVITIGGGVIDKIPLYFDLATKFVSANALPPAIEACRIMRTGVIDSESILHGIADLVLNNGKDINEFNANNQK